MKSVLIYYFAIGAVVNFLWILLTMWADKDLLTKEDLRNPLGFIFAFISIYNKKFSKKIISNSFMLALKKNYLNIYPHLNLL